MVSSEGEPQVDHLGSKQHATLYKQRWKGVKMEAGANFSMLRQGNDREKKNVWEQRVFFPILQELLSSK